jgi:hypothetical protein
MLKPFHKPRDGRRGGALMWSIAALALALVMTPLYVAACRSLAALTSRGGHRLIASYDLPDLPGGTCRIQLLPADSGLRRAEVTVTWDEGERKASCRWTTLVPGGRS